MREMALIITCNQHITIPNTVEKKVKSQVIHPSIADLSIVLLKVVSHQQYPSTHICTYFTKIYHLATCYSIINRHNKWLNYGYITQLHVSIVHGQRYIYVTEYLNMPQNRDSVIHKICIRN